MSVPFTTVQSASAASWRTYVIPIAVLLIGSGLTVLLYKNFESAITVTAPIVAGACVLCALLGVVYWAAAVQTGRRRARRHAAMTAIVDNLATGRPTGAATWIGDSWRALEAVRALAANRSKTELDSIRAGLKQLGVPNRVAARARKSRRKWERVRAIRDLGWLDHTDALPILYDALADPDNDIAWSAIAALAEMTDPIADQVLFELLDDGRFAPSRIADLLDARREQRPISVLQERARASSESSLFWIAYLLGRSRQPEAVTPLLELAHHPSSNVRASAAEALGRIGSPAAIDTLLSMVGDEVWFVRLHASRSLGELQAEKGVPVLRNAVQDSSWWVRRSAVDALHRMRIVV